MCCSTGSGSGPPRPWAAPPAAADTNYPWPDTTPAADLVAARRLIEQHGYGRPLPELAAAEAALAGRAG